MSLIALGACARSQPTRFYVLTPLAAEQRQEPIDANERRLVIAIDPVEIPEYLDRPQITTREGNSCRLNLAEFDRWAEPMKSMLPRVLAENLSQLLATERVVLQTWKEKGAIDYRLSLAFVRFEGARAGKVLLVARWAIVDRDGQEVSPFTRSKVVIETAEPDYGALATAMSEAVMQLSREIAQTLQKLR
jgi:uncharacterized lipoprotein YmbA